MDLRASEPSMSGFFPVLRARTASSKFFRCPLKSMALGSAAPAPTSPNLAWNFCLVFIRRPFLPEVPDSKGIIPHEDGTVRTAEMDFGRVAGR